MKIQIIGHSNKIKSNDYKIVFAPFGKPNTFDSFDVNIIDLQDSNIWRNDKNSSMGLNCSNDLKSLQALIESAKKSKCIILLPENYTMSYCILSHRENRYEYHYLLKDRLNDLLTIINTLLPSNYDKRYEFRLVYELSKTKCCGSEFNSSFCFKAVDGITLTRAEGSGKATTIQYTEKSILTTLNLADSSLKDFLEAIGIKEIKREYPDWLINLERFDDGAQKERIEENSRKINELKQEINSSNEKLDKNLRYKSILTENGSPLVEVVFDILQQILNCDLSDFKDKMQEDFLIRLDGVTFVGEIKGVNTNVKSEHVTQLELHYQSYCDKLDEEKREENVKALLVINSQRTKPPEEREGVHEKQIAVAERNNSLIILTADLLEIYEMFLSRELSGEEILNAFKTKTGLLNISELKKI